MIFQILLITLFFLTLIAGVIVLTKKIRLAGIFLISVSVAGGLVTLDPEYATLFANYLGIGRGVDLVLYLWSLTNFLFIGLLLSKTYRAEQRQVEALRKLSVKNFLQEEISKNE